jgi:hypothetical protein
MPRERVTTAGDSSDYHRAFVKVNLDLSRRHCVKRGCIDNIEKRFIWGKHMFRTTVAIMIGDLGD